MPNTLANLARMTTATTGTGTITLGSAVEGFLAFADELASGSVITYAIEDGNQREIGQGTFTISGATHTLTRSTVYASTQGGAQISLSGSAQVFVTAAAEDFADASVAANVAALQAVANPSANRAIWLAETNKTGWFVFNASNLSSTLVRSTGTVSGVNTSTEQLTVTAHGLADGDAVIASSTDLGLSTSTIYYVNVADANTITLHTTYANALAGTSAVNLTGSVSSLSIKKLLDPNQGVYVIPTGSALDGSDGAWVRQFERNVLFDWFGAAGDASKPSASSSTSVTGTDDTQAIRAACWFVQELNPQPNLFTGFEGGYVLTGTPDKIYYVRGDNPLGTQQPRSSAGGDAGALARQSYAIDGRGCIFLWYVTATDDRFLESHETFTRTDYRQFVVMPVNLTTVRGTVFSNQANAGRNALALQVLNQVEVQMIGSTINSNTLGVKRIFYFTGNNLGDRLQVEDCAFRNFENVIYSTNPNSVSHHFTGTSLTSYLDNATWFHYLELGSGFSIEQSEILIKGDAATVLKTEFNTGDEINTRNAAAFFRIGTSRWECDESKDMRLVDLEWGSVHISECSMSLGGFPNDDYAFARVVGSASCVFEQCQLRGRVVVGAPLLNSGNYDFQRGWGILFDKCQLHFDMSKNLYFETEAGTQYTYKDAVKNDIEALPVIVRDTQNRRIDWSTDGVADTKTYIQDMVYAGLYTPMLAMPAVQRAVLFNDAKASKFVYLDNDDFGVLPGLCAVTSIKITVDGVNTSTYADTVKIKVGTAEISVSLNSSDIYNQEVLFDRAIIISDTDTTERTISAEVLLSGVPLGSPSLIGFIEVEYRPAMGRNEVDVSSDPSTRASRVVSSANYYNRALITATQWGYLAAMNQSVASGQTPTFANLTLSGLPTSDPTVAGRLWNDGGTVKVSAG